MDSWNFNFSHFSFFVLLLFSFSTSTVTDTSSRVKLSPFKDVACSFINCGQGTCKASNKSLLGFHCECKHGWKKIQIGSLTFPSCLIPNCTVDFHCGKGSPSPPPPSAPLPPPPPPPPLNQTKHCDHVWCGDGKCVTNGTGHICQCNQGSENLLNLHGQACFKPCYFGGDCEGLGLHLPLKTPHPPPPPPPSSSSNGLKGSRTLCRLTVIVVLAAYLP